MAYKIGAIIIAAILSAVLYRLGGAKGYNSKYRDIGCPVILLALTAYLFGYQSNYLGAYILTFALSWAALSTYWDFVFNYDNHYAHGFGCGLAALSLIWAGVPLWVLIVRIVICTVGMGLWSAWTDNDVKEELGRGALFI